MSNFTQGPWVRNKYGNIVDANGVDIIFRGVSTLCSGSSERMTMAEANSDLAAAAPDLLAALLAITNSGPDAIPIKEAFEMAHRAIERASGGKV